MSDEYTGCVVCGEQPRGEVFGKPVCHANHAEKVVNDDLRELTEHLRKEATVTGDSTAGKLDAGYANYQNGSSDGMEYAADKLEGLLDD